MLSELTGETDAGKSIIVDVMDTLPGGRAYGQADQYHTEEEVEPVK